MDGARVGLVVVAVAVGIGAAAGAMTRETPSPTSPTAMSDVPQPEWIEVHVSGAVVAPGVVRIPDGSNVADAVAAAGGLTSDAVPGSVNLAASVVDGDQLTVPSAVGAGEQPVVVGDGLISINKASPADLEGLPGVGPVLADRIVAYREEHGLFQRIEDLLDVPGIGESKLATIRDLVRVP